MRTIKRLMDGALGSRGAWLLEPYADLPTSTGLNTVAPDEMKATVRVRHRERLPGRNARHRRPRQPRDAECLRGDLQGAPGQEGRPLANRTRAAHRRAPTFRGSARSASSPPCRASTARRTRRTCSPGWRPARRGRRLRVAEADEDGRDVIANGTDAPVEETDPLPGLLRARHPQAEERRGVLRRPEDDARRGARGLHPQRRLRGVRGEDEGLARRRASSPISSSCRPTSRRSRRRRSRRRKCSTRLSVGRWRIRSSRLAAGS